jgi:hypothetical protein
MLRRITLGTLMNAPLELTASNVVDYGNSCRPCKFFARISPFSKEMTHPIVFSVHGIVEDISDSRLTDAITCGFNLLFLP